MIDRMQIPASVPEPSRKPRQPLPAKANEQSGGFQEMVQKAAPKEPVPTSRGESQTKESGLVVPLQGAPKQAPMPAAVSSSHVSAIAAIVPQAVELHLDVQTGEREVVTLPWTLVANGLFGESIGRVGQIATGAQIGMQPSVLTDVQFGGSPAVGLAAEEMDASGLVSCESANGVALGQAWAHREATESVERTRVERQPASALASVLWQKKLLRILENQEEGRSSVYYRDYSVTHDELDQVIAHVRDLAERAGGSVQRVLVNGAEVWSKSMQRGA